MQWFILYISLMVGFCDDNRMLFCLANEDELQSAKCNQNFALQQILR